MAIHTAKSASEVATGLNEHGVMAGGGNFYAVRCLRAMGCDPEEGVVRLSFVHYTSDAEVEQLMKGLDCTL